MSINLRVMAVQAAGIGQAFAASGVFETDGPNKSEQITFWQHLAGGVAGESYCDDAVFAWNCKSYCQIKGYLAGITDHDNRAIMLDHADEFARRCGIPRTGSCRLSMDVAKKRGRFKDKSVVPWPGDQVFFDYPVHGHTLGYAHHTGLVIDVYENGTLRTVEANTSATEAGDQSNGEGCYVKTRSIAHVLGYMHLEGLV